MANQNGSGFIPVQELMKKNNQGQSSTGFVPVRDLLKQQPGGGESSGFIPVRELIKEEQQAQPAAGTANYQTPVISEAKQTLQKVGAAMSSAMGNRKVAGPASAIVSGIGSFGDVIPTNVDADTINGYFEKTDRFLTRASEDQATENWEIITDPSTARERQQMMKELHRESLKLRMWFELNKDYIDEETYNTYTGYLDDAKKSVDAASKFYETVDSFGSQAEYKTALNQQRIMEQYMDGGILAAWSNLSRLQQEGASESQINGATATLQRIASGVDLSTVLTRLQEMDSAINYAKLKGEDTTVLEQERDYLKNYYEAVRYYKYAGEYKGMSYQELMSAIDTQERFLAGAQNLDASVWTHNNTSLQQEQDKLEWLKQYAPTRKKSRDYILENEEYAADLEQDLKTLEMLAKEDWEKEEEFAASLREKYQIPQTAGSVNDWINNTIWDLETANKYLYLPMNADFDRLSKYDENLSKGDELYRIINSPAESSRLQDVLYYKYSNMDPEEVHIYNYVYKTQGKKAAEEYLKLIDRDLRSRTQEEIYDIILTDVENHPWLGLLSVPADYAFSTPAGLEYFGKSIYRSIKSLATGERQAPVTLSSLSIAFGPYGSNLNSATVAYLQEEYPNLHINIDEKKNPKLAAIFNGHGLTDLYQLANAGIQVGMQVLAGEILIGLGMSQKAASAITAILPSATAYTTTVLDAVSKGASDEQAMIMGVGAGLFEWLFEKYEIENIIKDADKSGIKAFISNGLTEAIGESGTTVANMMTDSMVMQDLSQFNQAVDYYKSLGMKEKEASKTAWVSLGANMLADGTIGFLSGGIFGAGKSKMQSAKQNAYAQYLYGEQMPAIVEQVLQQDPGNQMALQIKADLDAGKKLKSSTIFDFVTENRSLVSLALENLQLTTKRQSELVADAQQVTAPQQIIDAQQATDAQLQVQAFVGRSGKEWSTQQAQLLAEIPDQSLQSAMDKFGKQALTFDIIDLQNNPETQQAWIDAGLTFGLPGQEQYVEWDAIQDEYFRRQTLPQTAHTQEAAPAQEIAQKETPSSGAKETVEWAKSMYEQGAMTQEEYEGIVELARRYDQSAAEPRTPTASSVATATQQPSSVTNQPFVITDPAQVGTDQPAAAKEKTYPAAKGTGYLQLDNPMVPVSQEMWDEMKQIVDLTGQKVILFAEEPDGDNVHNGYEQDGVLHVNIYGVNPVAWTVGHEFCHSIKGTKEHESLKQLALRSIERRGGNLKQMRQDKRNLYKKSGVNFQYNDEGRRKVDNELAADYLGKYCFTDVQSIREMVEYDPTLGQRFLRWIDGILGAFGNRQAAERHFLHKTRLLLQNALNGQTTPLKAKQQKAAPSTGTTYDAAEAERRARQAYADGRIDEAALNDILNSLAEEDYSQQVEVANVKKKSAAPAASSTKTMDNGENHSYSSTENFKKPITIEDVFALRRVGRKSINEFSDDDFRKAEKWAHRYKELGVKSPFFRAWFGEWRAYSKERIVVAEIPQYIDTNEERKKNRGSVVNSDTKWTIQVSREGETNTISHSGHKRLSEFGLSGIRGLIENGVLLNSEVHQHHKNNAQNDYIAFDHKLYALGKNASGEISLYRITVEEFFQSKKEPTNKKFHNLKYIEKIADITGGRTSGKNRSGGSTNGNSAIIYSIADLVGFVNKYDNEFCSAPTVHQSMLNSDGAPKVMYHGSLAQFTIFDRSKAKSSGLYGRGFYFTDSSSNADLYGEKYSVYLNIRNPLQPGGSTVTREQVRNFIEAIAENEDYSIENYGTYDTDTILGIVMGQNSQADAFQVIQDLNATAIGDMVEGVELFNQVNGTSFDGIVVPTETVAFYPEQIKSATDNIGTFDGGDPDINHSYSPNTAAEQVGEQTEDAPVKVELTRENIPSKAKTLLVKAENALRTKLEKALSVPKGVSRESLKPIVQQISAEYLRSGTVSQETVDRLFDEAYEKGVVEDREFYDQYKHIKDHLRTTAVTLSQQDRADIADFDDFRKRARNLLKIKDEGGLPVDSAYQELSDMAPELFPESITHPADQLQRMYEVADSIRIREHSLHDAYGVDEKEFKKLERNNFEVAVYDNLSELKAIKRYAEDRLDDHGREKIATEEEAVEAWKLLKSASNQADKAVRNNLLTESDQQQVGRLLRGEISLEHLDPEKDNVRGITAVYEAKQEYEELSRKLEAYKRSIKAKYRELADSFLGTIQQWKDKQWGLLYSRETMWRNVQDIVNDPDLAERINEEYFYAVNTAEAKSTRMKNKYRSRVRELNLSRKVAKGNLVSEAHAVQLYGEAMDNVRMLEKSRGFRNVRDGKTAQEWRDVIHNLWAENPNLDQEKIKKAVEEFRKIYDELFQRMNEVRVRNGYEPVNYRNGYFPHFQPGEENVIAQFGKVFGIEQVDALPTTINGLTHMFRPGTQWFGNAQERLGFNTAYDAVEGFDRYIEGIAGVIHQTDNIQKLRALASQIRYMASDDGVREQVDKVRDDDRLTDEEKNVQIADIYEKAKYSLSRFVVELDEYTNLLANKKSRRDRIMEADVNRQFYNFMRKWESRVAANMVGGNIASALTNFIPLTQAWGRISTGNMLKGMAGTLKAIRVGDGIETMSDFLTNRRGSDPVVRNWIQTTSNALGKPMEIVDSFVSGWIVRAAYYQNISRNMSQAEAMHQADLLAASVMGDRSKGAMPTLFASLNPVVKNFTRFQLEVNNQLSEVMKDVPRTYRDRSKWALIGAYSKYFLGACLFNALYYLLCGRKPALDPIDMLFGIVEDIKDGKGAKEVFEGFSEDVLESLPFTSVLSLFGIEMEDGRYPVSSSIPDIFGIVDGISSGNWDDVWKEAQKPLTYAVSPFGGGGQASKTYKGVKAFVEGGSYTKDADGNDVLQYPVFKDSPGDFASGLFKSTVFGKNSTKEAQKWVDSGFKSMSAKNTAIYKNLLEADVQDREAYDLVRQFSSITGKGAAEKKRELILDADIDNDAKTILVGAMLGTEMKTEKGKPSAYAKFLTMIDQGMSVDEYLEFKNNGGNVDKYIEFAEAGLHLDLCDDLTVALGKLEPEKGKEQVSNRQKWRTVIQTVDDHESQLKALEVLMQDTQYAKCAVAYDYEISPDLWVVMQEVLPLCDEDENGSYSNYEIQLAIDAVDGDLGSLVAAGWWGLEISEQASLSKKDKAVLWQLLTGAKSAENNPYDPKTGKKVLKDYEDLRESQKDED